MPVYFVVIILVIVIVIDSIRLFCSSKIALKEDQKELELEEMEKKKKIEKKMQKNK